jgi:hypothetical protein
LELYVKAFISLDVDPHILMHSQFYFYYLYVLYNAVEYC